MKRLPGILLLALCAAAFVVGQWRESKAVAANCTVVSVLLSNRSDRSKTVKLFDSIRSEDPALFDKLVRRAEKGDERLAAVQDDLACKVEPEPAKTTGAVAWPHLPIP